jgi:hypothetical protein
VILAVVEEMLMAIGRGVVLVRLLVVWRNSLFG